MAEVKVLVEGYAKELKNGWKCSSTCSLIKSDGKLIIFDPGCNRKMLLNSLREEKIGVKDVNFVILSHGHMDHSMLAGMFENAKVVSFESLLYDGDLMLEFEKDFLGKDVEIIKTPGHCSEHISAVVDTLKGKVVISGDIFWLVDGEKQKIDINKEDDSHPTELDMSKLISSRKKILEIADYIIPGHGKILEIKK